MPDLIQPPAPGIYPDVPFRAYLSWDCASRSSLSHMANWREYTPQDVRYAMLTDSPDTDALALGSALHAAVLEPDKPAWDLGPVNPKTGITYGRDAKAWADYTPENPGLPLLTSEQAEKMGPILIIDDQQQRRHAGNKNQNGYRAARPRCKPVQIQLLKQIGNRFC